MFQLKFLLRLTLIITCAPIVAAADTAKQSIAELRLPAQFVQDTGAANRIEAGDILRTVSQEIASAACHLHNDVAPDLSRRLLQDGVTKFDIMLDALQNGNPDVGIIGGEERRKTIVLLEQLQTAWSPIRASVVRIMENPMDTGAIDTIYGSATDLLDQTFLLLSELEGEYANPNEILQSDVMLLEVSGRQAMLTQRLSYVACRAWSGSSDANYDEALSTTLSQFDFAMNAMQNGMDSVGIAPPPTEEIASLLNNAAKDWDVIAGHIDGIKTGTDVGPDVTTELYELLAAKMHVMEKVSHLYAEHSKRVY